MNEPICTECKWCVIEHQMPMCSNPKCEEVQTGLMIGQQRLGFCSTLRMYRCGPKGKWFEPKESSISFEMPEMLKQTMKITWRMKLLIWLRRMHAKL